jgi:hypothetical protein
MVPEMGRTGTLWQRSGCSGQCFLEGAFLQLGSSSIGPCDETDPQCTDKPMTLWVDEIVVSRTPIGCEAFGG